MTRLLIVISAERLEAVRTAAAEFFGAVAEKSFVPMGSPNGDAPATHWWLAGLFDAAAMVQVGGLQEMFPEAHVESYEMETDAGRPVALMAEMGLVRVKTEPEGEA